MTDFGMIVSYFFQWLVTNWWAKEITFFGLSTSIGVITGFVVIGSVVLWFVRKLIG